MNGHEALNWDTILSLPITNPLVSFSLVLLAVLLSPILVKALRLPAVVGLILSGILLGPHLFGILEKSEFLDLLGTIGLIYIMFQAGLEMDLHQLSQRRNQTLLFGLLTFAIPLGFGIWTSMDFLGMALFPAILLASMYSSHTLLPYSLVSRLGLAKNRSVVVSVSGTIVTDGLAMLILAFMAAASHRELDWTFGVQLLVTIGLYSLLVFGGLPWLTKKFFSFFAQDPETQFIFVFSMMFLMSVLSLPAGLEPVIGAFMAGLALNRFIPESSLLMNRVQFVGSNIFIPFFLFKVGLIIDPHKLVADPQTWLVAGIMTAVALVAKFLAALITKFILKLTWNEGWVMFGLSVNQAAATLAAVLVGQQIGFFDERIVAGTVVMILVTCVVGAVTTERGAKALALETAAAPEKTARPQRTMVAVSNPETLSGLLELGFILHPPAAPEPLMVSMVVKDGYGAEERVVSAEKLLSHAVVQAVPRDRKITPVTGLDINLSAGLLRIVKARRVASLIVGWNAHYGLERSIFGSVLDEVVRESRCLLVVSHLKTGFEHASRILALIPPLLDVQAGFSLAFGALLDTAQKMGARVVVGGPQETLAGVKKLAQVLVRAPAYDEVVISPWHKCEDWLREGAQPEDLIVLFSARQGQLAWQPNLDRLPRKIVKTLSCRGLLVLYSPEDHLTAEETPASPSSGSLPIQKEKCLFSVDSPHLRDVLEQTLALTLPQDALSLLVPELTKIGLEEPVELKPGFVLIHTHSEMVTDFQIFASVLQTPLSWEGLKAPCQVIMTLISPKEQPPEQHLMKLGALARMVSPASFRQTFSQALSWDDWQKNLKSWEEKNT